MKNQRALFENNGYSWHRFEAYNPTASRNISRCSFTICIYTKDQLLDKRAEKYNTIYVQAGLPKHFKAGDVLSQSHIEDVTNNFKKRDTYLQSIYDREKKFNTTMNNPHDCVNAILLPSIGFARTVGQPEGAYPNFGMPAAMKVKWVCADRVAKVATNGGLPPPTFGRTSCTWISATAARRLVSRLAANFRSKFRANSKPDKR